MARSRTSRRAEPQIILGPILFFRGEQGDRWRLSALFMLKGEREPEDLRADGVTLPIPPRHVSSLGDRHLWRFDFAMPRAVQDAELRYGFPEGESWPVTVPGRHLQPRLAYVSGNALGTGGRAVGPSAPRNALWGDLLTRHRGEGFHLLLHGGDQVDADALWSAVPPDAVDSDAAADAGFDLYHRAWSWPEVAAVLARVPSVMMWDTRDGGETAEQGAREKARRDAALFQIGAAPDALPECVWGQETGDLSQGHRIGEVGLLALDLRTGHGPDRVLTPETWERLPEWLDRFKGCRHLLVMSAAPLLLPSTGGIGGVFSRIGGRLGGREAGADEAATLWRRPEHTAEGRRLVTRLANHSRRSGARVTILSGGQRLGGRAVLRGGGVEMWQLLAPAIVEPPPSQVAVAAMDWAARRTVALPDGYTVELPTFSESGRRYIAQRGWLTLVFDGKGQIHARWSVAGEPDRYVQVI